MDSASAVPIIGIIGKNRYWYRYISFLPDIGIRRIGIGMGRIVMASVKTLLYSFKF